MSVAQRITKTKKMNDLEEKAQKEELNPYSVKELMKLNKKGISGK